MLPKNIIALDINNQPSTPTSEPFCIRRAATMMKKKAIKAKMMLMIEL
jgi:hypothetical protein